MKSLLVLSALFVSSLGMVSAYADEPTCGGMFAYQPGAASLSDARNPFATELEILLSDCEVQKKISAVEGSNFSINSFSKDDNGSQVLVFDVEAFADPQRPTHSRCTLTKTVTILPVVAPSTAPGTPIVVPDFPSTKTDVTLSCTKPVCTEADSYLCKK